MGSLDPMLRTLSILMTAAFLFFCSFARAEEAPIPATPTQWVTDTAGFLSPETQQALEKKLQQYEKTSGLKVALWIGTTAGGATLETWASSAISAWSVREKKFAEGVVMFILTQDHAIDVEVAPGLGKRLPDEFVGQMIFEQMAPRLDKGDTNGALTAGMDALLAKLEATKSEATQKESTPQANPRTNPQTAPQTPQTTKPGGEKSPKTTQTPAETEPTTRGPSIFLLAALGALILLTTVLIGVIGWPRKAKKSSK